MTRAQDLKNLLKGDVFADNKTRRTFSTDASLFEIEPEVVVAPRNVEDLKKLVQYASENERVSLTARSGGTGMDGGALTESIVVDFGKHFNEIGEVGEDYAITQPGVYYRDFEKATLAKNLLMPSYPASREICMLGGMVSNNAGGEKTLLYGKTEDYINELKVVFADGNEYVVKPLTKSELDEKMAQQDFEGELYKNIFTLIDNNYEEIKAAKPKVHKNSAGYFLWNVWDRETGVFDLTKLIVGSQGTLGLVTEINFKLVTPQPESQMMVVFLDELTNVGAIVHSVLGHKPTTFESYDDKTLKLALRFWWEFIKRLGLRNIFVLAWNGIPEALSIVRHGLPKLVLQITFEGDDKEELAERARTLKRELEEYSPRYMEVIKNPHEADEYWLVRRESFNLLRHKVSGMKTAPFIDDISVPPACLPEFFPRLNALLDEYKDYMIHNIAGHIGDGNFHIIPLMDFTNKEALEKIPEIAQRVYDLVFEYGGSSTGEHNDGIIRSPFLKQMYGDGIYKLFEETKNVFDPKNIFNPGKKVGATLEYATGHIKKHN